VRLPRLPDYLRRGLELVIVGLNPGERSARVGHYYAGRGNTFWDLLYESGLTPERLRPEEDARVLEFGLGLTDVVKCGSKSASDLGAEDFRRGLARLRACLHRAGPRVVAFNGKLGCEKFIGHPAKLGWQRERFEGMRIFVLPSTSGRNSTLTRAAKLAWFRRLAREVRDVR
jgi:double-stranded uracil-DNA glycosylase